MPVVQRAETLGPSSLPAITGRPVLVGFVGSALTAVGGLGSAFLPANNPLQSIPVIGALQAAPGRFVATVLLIGGVAMLMHAWLSLRTQLGSVRSLPTVVALWAAPLVFAPPMFSRDAWSYAAQGHLTHLGFNPYETAPAAIPGRFAETVDPLWYHTPAPYGPLVLQMSRGIVEVTGSSPYVSAVSMRIISLAGLALIVFVVPRLARAIDTDPSYAMWLGVLNPLTLLHFVGGIHNDALMVGLMLLGLYLGVRRRHVLGAIAIAAAVAVKAPAAVALGPLAYLWARRMPWFPAWRLRNVLGFAASGITALVAFAAITSATGLGYGWLGTLDVPASIRPVLSPPTLLGLASGTFLELIGLAQAAEYAVPVARTAGSIVGVVLIGWLLLRRAADRPVHTTALMLLAVALLGPVLHAWYVLWGGIALAVTDQSERTRRIVIWATAALTCYSALDGAFKNGALSFGGSVTLVLAYLLISRHRHTARPTADRSS